MNKKKLIIIIVIVAAVLVAAGVTLGLVFGLRKPVPAVIAIEGNADNVVIDEDAHTISCNVSAEIAAFDVSQLKYSVTDKNLSVAVYADEELTEKTDVLLLAKGENVFYVKLTLNEVQSVYTFKIVRHAHTFAEEWTVNDTHHWHVATCGHTELTGDKAAHDWEDGETIVDATETTEGRIRQICKVCGRTREVTTGFAEHVHTFDTNRWTYDEDFHWHAATCAHTDLVADRTAHEWGAPEMIKEPTFTEEGEKIYTCRVCGKTIKEAVQIYSYYTVEYLGYRNGEFTVLFTDNVAYGSDCVFYYEADERDDYDFAGWTIARYDEETEAYTIPAADVVLYSVDGTLKVEAVYKRIYYVRYLDHD